VRRGRVDRRLAIRAERDALRDRFAETGAKLKIGAHERRGPHVDDKRITVGRKTAGNRVRAESRPRAAERSNGGRSRHRMDDNQTGAGDHFTVVRAASGHPGVGEANDGEAARLNARNRRLRGAIGCYDPSVVATVQ
jgi:hypothetical protein